LVLKLKLVFVVIFLYPLVSMASENGGYAGSFLRIGVGARAISMGNTGVAHPMNAYSTFYNPAVIGFAEDKRIGLSYSFLSLDRRFGFGSFSMKVPPEAGFTVAWIESGVGDLKSYNSNGEETGNINHSANAVYFTFGRKIIENLSIGVSIKILFEYINDGTDEFDYSSNGVGFDFGVIYKISDDLIIGGQVKDINSKFKANTDNIFDRGGTTIDKFPVTYKFGAFYKTSLQWLRGAYDFEWSDKGLKKHHLGLEAVYGNNLALRLGLNGSHLAYGAGMDFEVMKTESYLDYAFVTSVIDEGSSHIFSWQLIF
jgi:hypothetical protein